jgi:hypothetical protein
MFPLPGGCLYFTSHTADENENTDLLRSCSGESAQLINSFDFRERLQNKVLYAGEKDLYNATANSAYPDVYVFSTNPFKPDFDYNDYAILKYKDTPAPGPTPSPSPPGPKPNPNPYPDTGINLFQLLACFAVLMSFSVTGFARRKI